MKTKFYQIVFLCLVFVGIAGVVNAQTKGDTYDPFTLDNVNALTETKVVTEDSYHTYTYTGDEHLSGSTFVFKVVGGTIVKAIGSPEAADASETNGTGTHSVAATGNKGSIIVLWGADDGIQKYVAVYELSANGCILNNTIQGLKISVGSKPTLALALTDKDACSTDIIPIDLTVTNGTSPWEVVVNDGTKDITFYFSTADVTGVTGYDHTAKVTPNAATKAFTYNWGATGYVNNNTDGTDLTFTFTSKSVDDAVTKAETNDTGILVTGKITDTATVHPLPVAGSMVQAD